MRKWTKKITDYGTSGYYVSARYGRDLPEDPAYHPVDNPDPTAYGGPANPLKSFEKFYQSSLNSSVCMLDSAWINLSSDYSYRTIVGDGYVIVKTSGYILASKFHNIWAINCRSNHGNNGNYFYGCFCLNVSSKDIYDSVIIKSTLVSTSSQNHLIMRNVTAVDCYIADRSADVRDCIFVDLRETSYMYSDVYAHDYSLFVNTKLNRNGELKSLAELKAGGEWLKSFDENDIGATTAFDIFNNPIDVTESNFMFADFSLRPEVSEKVRYGGDTGGYLGAYDVAVRLTAESLWNDYKSTSQNLVLESGFFITLDNSQEGVFHSTAIPLGHALTVDGIDFASETAWSAEGWANARMDDTPYETADPATEQRSAFVFEADFFSNGAWTGWKKMEPGVGFVDSNGKGNMDTGYDPDTAQLIPNVTQIKIGFTLRKEVTA
ncbi:hypothetical protein FUAX_40720 (plasmid) [Fulvitalea axinellae]|uniref:Uncharacterized protein n=1 Tax=Fulvitalea axinellae TaxID=1182444 RepID=A0AAU9DCH7_9BACT|nr:hypothetical protein FUAX_32880 [Fulvitalea axinellae]BDD11640.1 hypothetical protein FUAX_40720 [Fulvitalea axinellae]